MYNMTYDFAHTNSNRIRIRNATATTAAETLSLSPH